MKVASFEMLREKLSNLAVPCGLTAIKTGTEVEDMSFEEIALLKEITRGILPLYVKIGGPEARNDMRNLAELQVEGIIAPMIESAYSLKNFIKTMQEILPPQFYDHVEKGINLETIQGFLNMDSILDSPYAKELDQITAARTDLSGSMELHPDDERVMATAAIIVERSKERSIRTSVGGAIHPDIASVIVNRVKPDTINTRHMVISSATLHQNAEEILIRSLEFEVDLYSYLSILPSPKRKVHAKRAETVRRRLQHSLQSVK